MGPYSSPTWSNAHDVTGVPPLGQIIGLLGQCRVVDVGDGRHSRREKPHVPIHLWERRQSGKVPRQWGWRYHNTVVLYYIIKLGLLQELKYYCRPALLHCWPWSVHKRRLWSLEMLQSKNGSGLDIRAGMSGKPPALPQAPEDQKTIKKIRESITNLSASASEVWASFCVFIFLVPGLPNFFRTWR